MTFDYFYNHILTLKSLGLILIIIIIILVIREIVAWYWKINKIVSLLEKIVENTEKTHKTLSENGEQKLSIGERLSEAGKALVK